MLHAAFWSRCRIWRLRLHQRPSVAKSAFRVLATANRSNRISGCFFLFLLTLRFLFLHLTTHFLQLDKRSTFAVTPWARLWRVVLRRIYNHKLFRQPSTKADADAGCNSLGSEMDVLKECNVWSGSDSDLSPLHTRPDKAKQAVYALSDVELHWAPLSVCGI